MKASVADPMRSSLIDAIETEKKQKQKRKSCKMEMVNYIMGRGTFAKTHPFELLFFMTTDP